MMLRHAGYRVQSCEGGSEAVALLAKAPDAFDVAIVDLVMPEMGGRDTLVALRQINPKLIVLLASGGGPPGDVPEMSSHEAVGFVQKPCSPAELAALVQEALDLHASWRP